MANVDTVIRRGCAPHPVFSLDSQRIGYAAFTGEEALIVVDGNE